ncbi:MAG: phytoene/squalene synthase family protein [Alphaproteobacteria bacterium]|nr:phytoene/squalene synthase family protein [Alphaproteobacteria bacterium]MBV9370800.1 phytoene/squalene synthase family protein [Alphaproteobacteria bacterium]MBV9900120.1 phytoene/squalene synthase family protein [Alphaproteobacteria bacterium]
MASRLFDRTTRERAWLLYCWCRHCDDVCDGQALGRGGGVGGAGMAESERLTALALAGQPTGRTPFDALAALVAECPIPRRLIEDHLEGFRLDEQGWRPADEADLLRYCYHVAGAVGCMMAVVMGVPADEEATLARAGELGIAFQLSNIARDVAADHDSGRCYIPAAWLAAQGLTERNLLHGSNRARLVTLVRRICGLAEVFEASARAGVARLPFRSRWAILSAAGIYGRIGRRVAALGTEAWEKRVFVPRREKAAIMMSALGEAIVA